MMFKQDETIKHEDMVKYSSVNRFMHSITFIKMLDTREQKLQQQKVQVV